MIEIIVPESKSEILKQIKALEYKLEKDIPQKDREIYTRALKKLREALKEKSG